MFNSQYQEFIFTRTYARWVDELSRRETWSEAVARYTDFMVRRVPKAHQDEFRQAAAQIRPLLVMPSMRALWTAGPALEKENLAGYNCAGTVIDNPRVFAEMLYLLLCGTGVGFSVERQYVNKLPKVPCFLQHAAEVIQVADSKRGWAEGFNRLINRLFAGGIPRWDLSKVRPAGSPLKTFGGRASGPEPLYELFGFTVRLFKAAQGRNLSSLECHDLCCQIAGAVIVGGVRRAACISLSNLSDDRMAKAKSGEFWLTNPQRTMANNSVAYTEKPGARKFLSEWMKLVESRTGERGIFNREGAQRMLPERRESHPDFVVNPCLHGDTLIETMAGPVTVKDLSEIGEGWVFTMLEDMSFILLKATEIRRTQVNAKLLTITTQEGEIKCTPNHPLAVRGAGGFEWAEAKDIKSGDKLIGFNHQSGGEAVGVLSVEDRGETADVFNMEVEDTHNFVANGVVVHNCGEVLLRPNQLCNLTEAVVRPGDSLADLIHKVEAATVLGCVQATLTDFNFVSKKWRDNCEEERLLGVSLTGLRDHGVLGTVNPGAMKLLDSLKKHVLNTAEKWSKILGIPMPAATTCVKPSGSVSQVVDSSSGLHTRYAPYYIRRVRVSAMDPMVEMMEGAGFSWKPEVGQTRENASIVVFEFPQAAPERAVVSSTVTAMEQLEYWRMLKAYWTEHNPSCTIHVQDHEWVDVGAWVYRHWDEICGLSFLPADTGVYQLAPYEEIDAETYHRLLAATPDIDFGRLSEYEKRDHTTGAQELACSGGSCEII